MLIEFGDFGTAQLSAHHGDLLLRDHGVTTLWNRCACENTRGLSLFECNCTGILACGNACDNIIVLRFILRVQVQRVAIHRAVGEQRCIVLGADVLR